MIQIIVAGGNPCPGDLGGAYAEECLMVPSVKVELAVEVPPGVAEEGENVHVAALGNGPQVRFTVLSNPLEGVTTTVYVALAPETIVLSAGETDSE